MGPLAAYSIKSAILLSALLAIYMLTLGRQRDASMRRITLLCICIVSIFLPLFFTLGFRESAIQKVIVYTDPTPTEITGTIPMSIIEKAITAMIVSGICIGVIVTIFVLARLLMLRTKRAYSQGHQFRIMPEGHNSIFCFCGRIYLSEEDFSHLPEMILTHEASHIRHLHFIDLFLGRILLILQWWNPAAWLFVREIQHVHEYQADNDVLTAGYDRMEYQYLLLNRAIGDTKYGFASGFKHRELKRRLKMINRENSGKGKGLALLIMLISATCVAVALPRSPMIILINDKLSAISLNSFRSTSGDTVTKILAEPPHVIIDGVPCLYEAISALDPNAVESITVWKDRPEYPNGVIEIKTKPGTEIYRTGDSPETEEIRVIGAIAAKKE